MVRGGVHAHIVIEHEQQTKETDDAERGNHPSAKPAALWLGISELRDTDAQAKSGGIDEIASEIQQSVPDSKLLGKIKVAGNEVKQGVAQTSGSEGSGEQAQTRAGFEVAHEGWVEEKIDEEFLVIVVVTVPKFRDGARLQGAVSIAQSQKTGHPADSNILMSKVGQPEKLLKEGRNKRCPGQPARKRRACCIESKQVRVAGNAEMDMNDADQRLPEKKQYEGPSE